MSWMVNFEFLLHYCSKILGGVDSRVLLSIKGFCHKWSFIDEIQSMFSKKNLNFY